MLRSIRFLGVRTAAFEATVAIERDAPGLAPAHESPGADCFRPDRSAA